MVDNDLTYEVLKCAYKVHSELGPGLFESAYEACLYHELTKKDFNVEKQKGMPLIYDGIQLDIGYRIDLLIEDTVVVEIKTIKAFEDIHLAQMLTYLKLSKCEIGLLINFNKKYLKNGIKRVINET